MKRSRFVFLILSVIVLGAIAAGIAVIERPQRNVADGTVWTCSMHPQIRMDHPDRCPLCGMDLEPIKPKKNGRQHAGHEQAEHKHASHELELSEHARQMAVVETAEVAYRPLVKKIRTVGKVEFDETTVSEITARVGGRVDEVYASFPGTVVKEGQHLVSIYSPDLLSTQNEFLNGYRLDQGRPAASGLAASSRRRLELWGITAEQIEELIRSGRPQTHLTIYAPLGGTIVTKNIRPGQYVQEGAQLYTIADLGTVWLIVEVYEADLPWVKVGQQVSVSLEGSPAEPLQGMVGFIEPVLRESTRSVPVRVVLQNAQGALKPGMYAQALIEVPLMPDGAPGPTGVEGKYLCPMHPYIVAESPGKCPICKMPLERVPGEPRAAGPADPPQALAVPASAVLTTGKRQLVYVEKSPGRYLLVEPRLGPRAGDYYPVIAGLEPGQRVVLRGAFLIDSQFQIAGHPSLLYPAGISGGGVGHGGHSSSDSTKNPPAGHQH